MPISTAHASGFGPGPSKPRTFASEDDRRRLTPAALAGVRSLAEAWKLRGEDMAALLSVSSSTWDRITASTWKQTLNQDQMTRVSALIGIYKGLHLLFADDMADRWPQLPNAGPLFSEQSPVNAMIEGGIPIMIEVRRYVDALRGGL
ncbi:MAG: DUF2384 domain-containing protein [Rhodospirillaceae bacterium]|nr:DUF2384 domain-containing protein [Rhodospirillales bacterium]